MKIYSYLFFALSMILFINQETQARYSVHYTSSSTIPADRISRGGDFSCAVTSQNKLYCWGGNGSYQLGNGTTTNTTTPSFVSDQISSVNAGIGKTFAIKTDGSLLGWGGQTNGELGDGTVSGVRTSPYQIITSASPVRKVVTNSDPNLGNSVTCAILVNGLTKCWGDNRMGGVGLGVINSSIYTSPITSQMQNAIDIAMDGGGASCAVNTSGSVYCWGGGVAAITWKIGPSNAIAIAAGFSHYCVIQRSGGLACWGDNTYGQLGAGDTAAHSALVYPALPAAATSLTLGTGFTCARLVNGSMYCWGRNDSGQVGNGTFTGPVLTPYQTIASGAIEASNSQSKAPGACAIVVGGNAKCWGTYYVGASYTTPTTFLGGVQSFPSVSTNSTMNCAVNVNNTVGCWGKGYLGNGIDNPGYNNYVTVSNITDAIQVVTSPSHACALRANGLVVCWGGNAVGQLGNGGVSTALVPTTVSGLSGVSQISFSGTTDDTSTCAIKAVDGSVYCWGQNVNGTMAFGTSGLSVFYTTPQRYGTLTGIVALGGGGYGRCVLNSNSSVYCSGKGGYIDNNSSTVGSDTPYLAISGSGFLALSRDGVGGTCGLNRLGDLWCWGVGNTPGWIGDGTQVDRLLHVQNTKVGFVSSFSLGGYSPCSIGTVISTGTRGLSCWGTGTLGQMGDGTTNYVNLTPHMVSGILDYSDTVGEGQGPRVTKHSSFFGSFGGTAWGDNFYGQLDNGAGAPGAFSATPVNMTHYPQ